MTDSYKIVKLLEEDINVLRVIYFKKLEQAFMADKSKLTPDTISRVVEELLQEYLQELDVLFKLYANNSNVESNMQDYLKNFKYR